MDLLDTKLLNHIVNLKGIVMGKGSGRRKQDITDKELEDAWNRIFSGHPNEEDHARIRKKKVLPEENGDDDGYGNIIKGND